MINTDEKRFLTVSGVKSQAEFGIDESDYSHIFSILRDSLYSNKILAVLREYGANAWDANRDNGKGDVPIMVILPTLMDTSLSIRDYGKGLSESQVFNIYAKYGKSTKRDSNDSIGSFGIGAKSAFCYNDTFSVTSYHEGKKTLYHAVIDPSNKGIIMKMHEEDWDPNDTGIEIKVPVHTQDIATFKDEAAKLFRYFKPQPAIKGINLESEKDRFLIAENEFGVLKKGYGQWVCVMGCIPYNMDINMFEKHNIKFPQNFHGIMRFEIGELTVAASRETLEYKPRTIENIKKRITSLSEVITSSYQKLIDDKVMNSMDKRRAMIKVLESWGHYIPEHLEQDVRNIKKQTRFLNLDRDSIKELDYLKDGSSVDVDTNEEEEEEENDTSAVIPEVEALEAEINASAQGLLGPKVKKKLPLSFQKGTAHSISVDCTLVLIDTLLGPIKYYINFYNYIFLKRSPDFDHWTYDQCKTYLNECLLLCKCDGMKVVMSSSLDGYYRPPTKVINNVKYNRKVLALVKPDAPNSLQGQRNWEPYKVTDEDKQRAVIPYVRIHRFKLRDGADKTTAAWRTMMALDQKYLKTLGSEAPLLIAFKEAVTDDNINKLKRVGYNLVPLLEVYETWHKKLLGSLDAHTINYLKYKAYTHILDYKELKIANIQNMLGKEHWICQFIDKMIKVKGAPTPPGYTALGNLFVAEYGEVRQLEEMTALKKRYPVLTQIANYGQSELDGIFTQPQLACDYIKAIDKLEFLEEFVKTMPADMTGGNASLYTPEGV